MILDRKNLKISLIVFLVFFTCNNLFAQSSNFTEFKDFLENNQSDKKKFAPLYIGNFLSSLFALKNRDYFNSLKFSKLSLESKFENLDLLDNAFDSNIYLGKIEDALKIVANIELVSENLDKKYFYPIISEQLKRKDLSGALEISSNLSLEKHDVFLSKMINIWNFVILDQKEKAIINLDRFKNENKLNPEIFYYLMVQGLIISSYLGDNEEIKSRYYSLKDEINKIPSRYYLDIAKIVYRNIDEKEAKEFLINNLPKNQDLNLSIKILEDFEDRQLQYHLSKIFYEAGYILAKTKGVLESVPHFWYSLHIDINNDQSRIILANFFSNIDQIDLALELLDESTFKSPSWIIVEFEKSYLYEQKGNVDLAVSLIEKFSKNSDFSTKALLRISNIHRRNKDYEKSLQILNSVDTSKVDVPELHYYKSLNLVHLQRWKDAIDSFSTLLKVYPNNAEISNFVGYILVDRNTRLDEGISLINFAVNREPQNGFFIDSLGWAYYKLGEYTKAIIYLERAVEIEPQEMEITDHLGDAYYKVGREKEARLVWKRALSLNGDDKLIKKIKVKLNSNFYK